MRGGRSSTIDNLRAREQTCTFVVPKKGSQVWALTGLVSTCPSQPSSQGLKYMVLWTALQLWLRKAGNKLCSAVSPARPILCRIDYRRLDAIEDICDGCSLQGLISVCEITGVQQDLHGLKLGAERESHFKLEKMLSNGRNSISAPLDDVLDELRGLASDRIVAVVPPAAGCPSTSPSHPRETTSDMMSLRKRGCLDLGTRVLLQQWPYTSGRKTWRGAADCYLISSNDIRTRRRTPNSMELATGRSQVLIERTALYVGDSWYFECSSRSSSPCTWNWSGIASTFRTTWWWPLVPKVCSSHSHWAEISPRI